MVRTAVVVAVLVSGCARGSAYLVKEVERGGVVHFSGPQRAEAARLALHLVNEKCGEGRFTVAAIDDLRAATVGSPSAEGTFVYESLTFECRADRQSTELTARVLSWAAQGQAAHEDQARAAEEIARPKIPLRCAENVDCVDGGICFDRVCRR